jgi:hypothetical protein
MATEIAVETSCKIFTQIVRQIRGYRRTVLVASTAEQAMETKMREDKNTIEHDEIVDLGAASELTLGDTPYTKDESLVQPDSRA